MQYFWYVLVCDMYIMIEAVQAVVVGIMVVGVLTRCALLHIVYNLKAAQMNMQHSLIQQLMLYELKLGHYTAEVTKNIYWAKSEGTLDHSTVTS